VKERAAHAQWLVSAARFAPALRVGATLGVEGLAIAVAMLLFAVFLMIVGASPFGVFADMWSGAFGTWFSTQNSLSRGAPLMLTALCTALPARLGLVIIGNEGALLLGGLGAAASSMALPKQGLPPLLALAVMLFAGALLGGLWITLAGVLRQRRGVNETISSLLLFYIGLAVFLHLVEGPLRDPSSLNKPSTYPIASENMMGTMPGMDVHWGLAFGLIACVLAYVLMEHTTFGFSARVVGGNLRAAKLAGLPVTRLLLLTCMLGGATAGLAGAIEVTAIHGAANSTLYAGLGFAGILVAFVARQHPLAVVPVAILMGGIQASGGVLQRRHNLPDAAVDVFKGILFLVILASETYVGRAQEAVQRWIATRAEQDAQEAVTVPAPAITTTTSEEVAP
jgi:simple sugar transport system permease protein